MALISCPDCNREISDMAKACPSCGHPIAALTIEATGKNYKLMMVIGAIAAIIGFIFCFIYPLFGLIALVLGTGLCIYARSGAWWHHG